MRYHLILISIAYYQNTHTQKVTSVGKDVDKLEPMCNVAGNVKWYSLCGKQYGGSLKS